MSHSHAHAHHHADPHAHSPAAAELAAVGNQYIVVVEPHFALYRYLRVVRSQGYRTLVLAIDPESTLAGERKNALRLAQEGGSQIDRLVPYERLDVESLLAAVAPYRSEIAGVVAGEDAAVPIAAELG
ncbi:MAG TPA: hypothetical protein PK413_18790, partial [Thermoanaerobaculia bacterium]|nr:hypothetical protein [Thermoanaerobaculia bacterium]